MHETIHGFTFVDARPRINSNTNQYLQLPVSFYTCLLSRDEIEQEFAQLSKARIHSNILKPKFTLIELILI